MPVLHFDIETNMRGNKLEDWKTTVNKGAIKHIGKGV